MPSKPVKSFIPFFEDKPAAPKSFLRFFENDPHAPKDAEKPLVVEQAAEDHPEASCQIFLSNSDEKTQGSAKTSEPEPASEAKHNGSADSAPAKTIESSETEDACETKAKANPVDGQLSETAKDLGSG